MSSILNREPVMTLAVVQALLVLLVSFGIDLSTEQTGAILAASAAVLGWITRSKVTPA